VNTSPSLQHLRPPSASDDGDDEEEEEEEEEDTFQEHNWQMLLSPDSNLLAIIKVSLSLSLSLSLSSLCFFVPCSSGI
jgi:hypothetical protein